MEEHPTVETLLAERDIGRVLLRYCRGIDRMDRDLVASCYHADATDSHGSFQGDVEAFLRWVWRLLSSYDHTMHFLGNILIDIDPTQVGEPPRVAVSEAYGMAFHTSPDPKPSRNLVTGFRYVDRFERRPSPSGGLGPWLIARRVATTEWVRIDRPEDRWPVKETLLQGRRGRDDIVYHIRDT